MKLNLYELTRKENAVGYEKMITNSGRRLSPEEIVDVLNEQKLKIIQLEASLKECQELRIIERQKPDQPF